jgi:hypothetical protein
VQGKGALYPNYARIFTKKKKVYPYSRQQNPKKTLQR